jgi:hypothetical protein
MEQVNCCGVGTTLTEHVINAKNVTVSFFGGGSQTGVLKGFDSKFLYVLNGTTVIAMAWSRVEQLNIT